MASPPVARIIPIFLFFRSASVASMVGNVMHCTMPSGAPAFLAASQMTFAVSIIQFLAFGCGLMTMALPALIEIIDLYIVVDVGFVDGINAATTPIGTPTSISPFCLSSLMIPTVFMSLTLSHVIAEPSRFFNTLSCHIPNPVSSTAIFARRSD